MIPNYQELKLPILQICADNQPYDKKQLSDLLVHKLSISENDLAALIRSGKDTMFNNRIHWAKTFLKQAGLLHYPQRGLVQITIQGLDVLKQNPPHIDNAYLMRFPSFVEFMQRSNQRNGTKEHTVQNTNESISNETPEEIFENSYQELCSALAFELLEKVLSMPPDFFERLVVELLVKMGYGGSIYDAGEALGRSGDEGIDGVIKEDKLGLDVIYIQAKRWAKHNTVGRPELQKFVGALAGRGANKGIFITTSKFTADAEDYKPQNNTKIVLINGVQLADLMVEYNLGCSIQQTYEIKKIDNDYFDEN